MKRIKDLMKWLQLRTVARDLTAGVVLVVTIVVIVMGSINYFAVASLAEQELIQRLERTSEVIARRLSYKMNDKNYESAIAFLREAKKDLPDSEFRLEDENGTVIFFYSNSKTNKRPDYIYLEKDIILNDLFLGRIRLGMTSVRIANIKADMLRTMLSLMAVLILSLLLTIRWIVRRILIVPLDRIQEGVRIIADGNYDHRIASIRYKDIEAIIHEVNNMAHFISNRTLQLQREIGERKRTEIALTESRRKLMTLMQNLPGMAYRCQHDKEYTMRFVSQGVKALTGYDADQIVDNKELNYSQIIHPDDLEFVYQAVESGLAENSAFEMEYRIITSDGNEKWVWEAGVGVINVFGEIQALEGFIMDITSRRKAEENLRKLNEELEIRVRERTADLQVTNSALTESLKMIKQTQTQLVESEKLAALGGMVAGMAHEINNPLGISVTAGSFMESKLKEIHDLCKTAPDHHFDRMPELYRTLTNLQESARIIMSNLRRASELVNGFKKVASDQSQEEKRTFNFKQYLSEIILSLRPELKKTAVKVELKIEDNLIIDSYPGAISQIMTNLILNSLRHAYEPGDTGEIVIQTKHSRRFLIIVFSDDGKGIPKDILPKVFDPFFTTRRGDGGSGLGLHIIFNLITGTLNGEIHCDSLENEGTRFIIRIPYSELGSAAKLN